MRVCGLQAVDYYTIPDNNGFGNQCNINQMKLIGFVDAAYANDHRKRRSTTGLAFTLCGGATSLYYFYFSFLCRCLVVGINLCRQKIKRCEVRNE